MTEFNKLIATIFLAFQLWVGFAHSQSIILYTDYLKNGNKTELNISTCNHLPKTLAAKVVDINTNGNCARFYTSKDCTGKFKEILPRLPVHHVVGNWGHDNFSISIGPCPDQCGVNITGPPPAEDGLNVTLFDRPFYKGAMETINVKGCHILPRKFNYHVKSAITNVTAEGHCFQLYNNINCQLNWTAGHDSIELRPDTKHNDLSRLRLYPAKAISHCSFKCNKDGEYKGVSQHEDQELTNGNQVMLYDEENFKGNGLLINKTEDCVNLDQFVGWEGAAKSVKLHDDEPSCVVLYNLPNCVGDFKLALNSSMVELKSSKFNAETRSLQFCDPMVEEPLT